MVDYIPGVVLKVSLNQHSNDKIAVLYRFYDMKGYVKRIRIYDVKHMSCKKSQLTEDDLDRVFNETIDNSEQFTQDFYARSKRDYYDDFKIN